MNKNTRLVVLILVIAVILYFVSKFMSRTKNNGNGSEAWESYYPENNGSRTESPLSGQCIKPNFKDMDLSGRSCAGTLINENQTLKLGDQSCEVLLLQQRLNAMQSDKYILKPTGQFCCQTRYKLTLLMGVPQIALNQFSPDEQIGFNELEGGKKMTNYSYMDVNTKTR